MDPTDSENRVLRLQSRKQKSHNRRSSILKSPSRNVLGDLDTNTKCDGDTTRTFKSRRVSFAETFQIREFATDSPHTPELALNLDAAVERENTKQAHHGPSGLDKLLTGALCSSNPLLGDDDESSCDKNGAPPSMPEDTDECDSPSPAPVTDMVAFLDKLRSKPSQSHRNQGDLSVGARVQYGGEVEIVGNVDDDSPAPKTDISSFLANLKAKSAPKLDGRAEEESSAPKTDIMSLLAKLKTQPPPQKPLFDEVYKPPKQFPEPYFKETYNVTEKTNYVTMVNTTINKFTASPSGARSRIVHGKRAHPAGENSEQASKKPDRKSSNLSQVQSEEDFRWSLGTETDSSSPPESTGDSLSKRLIPQEWFSQSSDSKHCDIFDNAPSRTSRKHLPVNDKENLYVNVVEQAPVDRTDTKNANSELRYDTQVYHGPGNKTITQGMDMDMTTCHGNIHVDRSLNKGEKIGQNDITRRFDHEDLGADMEMTTCLGNIIVGQTKTADVTYRLTSEETTAGRDLTLCHGNIEASKTDLVQKCSRGEVVAEMNKMACIGGGDVNGTLSIHQTVKATELTMIFTAEEALGDMEMTTCLGTIDVNRANVSNNKPSANGTHNFPDEETDGTMEMTGCIGNINVSGTLNSNQKMPTSEMTRRFTGEEMDAGMEMTTCIGGIDVNKTLNSYQKMPTSEMTGRFTGEEMDAGMEMTTCIGSIDVNKTLNSNQKMPPSEMTRRFTGEEMDAGMEMTTCIGGIDVNRTLNSNQKMPASEMTRRFTGEEMDAGMEMTTCIGSIDVNKTLNSNQKMPPSEMIRRFTSEEMDTGMEMTTCVGGIDVNKTLNTNERIPKVDMTQKFTGEETEAGMEMTTCVGGIDVNKTLNSNERIPKVDMTRKFTGEETEAGMEMTTCIGGIDVNKTLNTNERIPKVDMTRKFTGEETEAGMEMTTCIGGIDVNRTLNSNQKMPPSEMIRRFTGEEMDAGMETTTCVGGIDVNRTLNSNQKMPPSEMTRRFTGEEMDAGMEMTTCVGGIDVNRTLNSNQKMPPSEMTRRFTGEEMDAGMEMTTCVGGIDVNRTLNSNQKMPPSEMTRRFTGEEMDAGMEMTTCVGGIDVNKTLNTNERIPKVDMTRQFTGEETEAGMEMTTCIGGIDVNKTLNTNERIPKVDMTRKFTGEETEAGMEMTTCIGGIDVNKTLNTNERIPKVDMTRKFTGEETEAGMEMTTCFGSIDVNKTLNSNQKMPASEMTRRFTGEEMDAGMEMTTCIGGIDVNRTLNSNQKMPPSEMTRRFTGEEMDAGMEMTTCVGGIDVNKTLNTNERIPKVDMTRKFTGEETEAGMEMTTCVGGIDVNKTLNTNERIPKVDMTRTFTGEETEAGMEMTTCIGGIDVNKTLNTNERIPKVDMTRKFTGEETEAGMEMTTCFGSIDVNKTLNSNQKMPASEMTRRFTGEEMDAGLEMTTCIGGIDVNRTLNSNQKMPPSEMTRRFTGEEMDAGMEMTPCIGGVDVNKTLNSNQKMPVSEMTRRFTGEEMDHGMEMTPCIGGIDVNKTLNSNQKMPPSEMTRRFTGEEMDAGMEMTPCIGGVDVNKTLNSNQKMPVSEMTRRFTGEEMDHGMEMTPCIGGIDVNKTLNSNQKMPKLDMTQKFIGEEAEAGMEMTTCLFNIDVNRTLNSNQKMPASEMSRRFTGEEMDAGMEMTTCIGGIDVNRTLNSKQKMPTSEMSLKYTGEESGAGMTCSPSIDCADVQPEMHGIGTDVHLNPNRDLACSVAKERRSESGLKNTGLNRNKVGEFQTLQATLRKQSLVSTRRSTDPMLYPPEKVQRLLGQSRRASNIAFIESKVNELKYGKSGPDSCGNSSERRIVSGQVKVEPKTPVPEAYPETFIYSKPDEDALRLSALQAGVTENSKTNSQNDKQVSQSHSDQVIGVCLSDQQLTNLSVCVSDASGFMPDSTKITASSTDAIFSNPEKAAEPALYSASMSTTEGSKKTTKESSSDDSLIDDNDGIPEAMEEFLQDGSLEEVPTMTQLPKWEDPVMAGAVHQPSASVSPVKVQGSQGPGENSTLSRVTNLPDTQASSYPEASQDVQGIAGEFPETHVNRSQAVSDHSSILEQENAGKAVNGDPVEDVSSKDALPEYSRKGDDSPVLFDETLPPFQRSQVNGRPQYDDDLEDREITFRFPLESSLMQPMNKTYSVPEGNTPTKEDPHKGDNHVSMHDTAVGDCPSQRSSCAEEAVQRNMSVLELPMSQSIGSSQHENTSHLSLTRSLSMSIMSSQSAAPTTVQDFLRMVCIASVIDSEAVSRRSSFAPVQRSGEELSLEEVLEKVLIDSCERDVLVIACSEMEARKDALLKDLVQIEDYLEEHNPPVFQKIVQSKADCREIQQQSKACLSACRKRARATAKGNRLRWLLMEAEKLKVNAERIESAVQEIEGLGGDVETQLQAVSEVLRLTEEQVAQLESVPLPTPEQLEQLGQVKGQLQVSSQELKEAKQELANIKSEIKGETEVKTALQAEVHGVESQAARLTDDRQTASEKLQEMYRKFSIRKSLTEWWLVECTGQSASFLFLHGYVRLDVEFWEDSPDKNNRLLDLISVKSGLTESAEPEDVLAHNLVVGALTEQVLDRYQWEEHLPQLLEDVSRLVWSARSMGRQLRTLPYKHCRTVTGTSVSAQFYNICKLQKCDVVFSFTPEMIPSSPAEVLVQPVSGQIDEAVIVSAAGSVLPGDNYLTKLVTAVEAVVGAGDRKTLWAKH